MHGRPRSAARLVAGLVVAACALAIGALPAQHDERTHWAYRPLVRPPAPAGLAPHADWACDDVDRFVLARLAEAGLAPSPEADRATLVRRSFAVLHGLPPTPEQIAHALRDDRGDWYERLVDELLASPRHAERQARHWLDVVRYADTHGFETNTPRPNAYRYRDWVIDAFDRDLPFDEFVIAQLAGDAVGADAATGFLVAGPWDEVKSPDRRLTAEQRSHELADMVGITGTALLGTTLGCARCHDHKFDPILQHDYYAVEAVLAGVRHGERALRPADDGARTARIAALEVLLARLDAELGDFEPIASATPITVLDDASTARDAEGRPRVELLREPAGHGANPPGSERGCAEDPGDDDRLLNLGAGRCTWWRAGAAPADAIAWRPGLTGRHRLWVSWGCGSDTHTTRARYVLDLDGDLATQDDQRELAVVDQQRFADGSGVASAQATAPSTAQTAAPPTKQPTAQPAEQPAEQPTAQPAAQPAEQPTAQPAAQPTEQPARQPLWSGLRDLGLVDFAADSTLLLRDGGDGRVLTADVIVLEPAASALHARLPNLRPPVHATGAVDRFAPQLARAVRMTIEATSNGSEPCLDELRAFSVAQAGRVPRDVALAIAGARASASSEYPDAAIHKIAHAIDGEVGNAHSWISAEPGAGWLQVDFATPQWIDRVAWARDALGEFGDRLPVRYRIEVQTADGTWRQVATGDDRVPHALAGDRRIALLQSRIAAGDHARVAALLAERARAGEELARRRDLPRGYAGTFEQPDPTHRLHRGDPLAPREAVAPGAIAAFGALALPADAPEQQRRLALARWIARPDHPLTARVIVNRIWQQHFGSGLVATPNDFGRNGAAPSHPELLDALASDFVASGWSLKRLHRRIVCSATWRQASAPRPEAIAVDADTRLLWRFPPRRLEAEAIRDTLLAVSGELDLSTVGGPGFDVFEPDTNYVRVYVPRETFAGALRRAVYAFQVRMEKDPTFGPFDCPDGGQSAPRRARSTTALQALSLLNSPFVVQRAGAFAARVEAEARDVPARVRRAFELALQRAPDRDELARGVALASQHGLPALCRALFNCNELLFVP